jgi:hypothetical protein
VKQALRSHSTLFGFLASLLLTALAGLATHWLWFVIALVFFAAFFMLPRWFAAS